MSDMSTTPNLPNVLLVEPQFVLRRTIGSVGKELGLMNFHEVTSLPHAAAPLQTTAFDCVVLDIGADTAVQGLIGRLRGGHTACAPDVPVIILVPPEKWTDGTATEQHGRVLRILRPFKISALMDSISGMVTRDREHQNLSKV